MKIAVIGAAGRAGSRIVEEAKSRGHQVTAIVRDPSKLASTQGIEVLVKDVFETGAELAGFDAVVNSFSAKPGAEQQHVDVIKHLIAVLKQTPDTVLYNVGGAGSLLVDDNGTRLLETPEFPAIYYATAKAQSDQLDVLRGEKELKWTFFSPAAIFEPGEKTGKVKLGNDHFLLNDNHESKLSMEDYASILLDEIERPQFPNQRFTAINV
ncbi:NAD(P)-dependent oxidoreductase [Paenibacillus sp. FJAT-27812]|uniref:NAD(P)-dependent oxidoreductase n=1 Tax=Paenibacillus sp. FJAT-27812 TaxID=1684143 RepID=UPI0006A7E2BA|nr:NAD(P)-dependent oxidoreductase [Paenibacillus sp. FJAT-27812]